MARPLPRWPVLAALLVVPIAITGFVLSGLIVQYQQLRAGAPGRATVTRCDHVPGSHDIRCTGSWQLDTRPGTGVVHGATDSDIGRVLDVHVVGDSAYADSQLGFLGGALVLLTLAPLVALALVARRIRRDRRDRTT
jgi:hypothetical protein